MKSLQVRGFYFTLFLITLFLGLSVFFFTNEWPLIRGTTGDFLIIIFLSAALKLIWPGANMSKIVIGVFLFSVVVEVLQYFELPHYFGKDKLLVRLILGSTFHWSDIVIYALGAISTLGLERLRNRLT